MRLDGQRISRVDDGGRPILFHRGRAVDPMARAQPFPLEHAVLHGFLGEHRVDLPRLEGRSAWSRSKKIKYSFDSIFNFTDLPLQWLLAVGFGVFLLSIALGAVVLWRRLSGSIQVAGYTPIVLMIMFFGGLTAIGLGIVGQYLWLSLQNARRRPNFVVQSRQSYPAAVPDDGE